MTMTALFAALTASKRLTLSAIVSSSSSAGTRKIHKNLSTASGSGSGARLSARRETAKRITVQTSVAMMSTNTP